MAVLHILQGPNTGRQFDCNGEATSIGRQADCDVCLESPAVSRQHAQIVHAGGQYFVAGLGRSNGPFLNGDRVRGRVPLTEDDTLQIGPYHLGLRLQPRPLTESDPIVRSQVPLSSNQSLYSSNAAYKLQVFVEIAQ